ncbi:hypothetical protein JT358_07215 [Micrococcales bacterium 31B]|nr:hypothetical protein [Micrococcales bacterium 31B]
MNRAVRTLGAGVSGALVGASSGFLLLIAIFFPGGLQSGTWAILIGLLYALFGAIAVSFGYMLVHLMRNAPSITEQHHGDWIYLADATLGGLVTLLVSLALMLTNSDPFSMAMAAYFGMVSFMYALLRSPLARSWRFA